MRFEGEVRQGMDYIILDDFITSGAELRDLRDYIQSRGGNVVLMTTFGHGSFGKLQDIRIDSKYIERLNASGITDQDLRKYGIASEIGCLTLGEQKQQLHDAAQAFNEHVSNSPLYQEWQEKFREAGFKVSRMRR